MTLALKKLSKLVVILARAFDNIGIKPLDVVTICLPAIPDASIVLYALNYIGAIGNFINPMNLAEHANLYLDGVNSKTIVILDEYFLAAHKEIKATATAPTHIRSNPLRKNASFVYGNLLELNQ